MGTIKRFWIYFLIFILAFFLVGFLTNAVMGDNYKIITNYEIVGTSPMITVTEIKTKNYQTYITGTITNDTGEYIPIKYLQIDLYDENNIYLGSEFKELKYFNIDETISFDISCEYVNVGKVVFGVTDKVIQDEELEQEAHTIDGVNVEPIITEETIRIGVPIGAGLVFHTFLGLF